jgi:hypothetical protein
MPTSIYITIFMDFIISTNITNEKYFSDTKGTQTGARGGHCMAGREGLP